MNIYDITTEIYAGMPVYKNKPEKAVEYTNMSNFDTGTAYETAVRLPTHTGTHLDMPLHMIPDGKASETYPVTGMMFKRAIVMDFSQMCCKLAISVEDLSDYDIQPGDFVLFKTASSRTEEFLFDFLYLDEAGANYLADLNVGGVGTDAMGIERLQPDHETHVALLSKDIAILEGLRLGHVPPGVYTLLALPMKMANLDALATRALLFTDPLYETLGKEGFEVIV